MNDKQRAAEALQKFAKQFKAIIEIIPDLESIGSLEQAETEARGRLSVAQSQEAEAEAKLLELHGQVRAAQEKFDRINAQSEAEYERIMECAAADADTVKKNAIHDAAAYTATVEQELTSTTEKIHARREELAALDHAVEKSQSQYDALVDKLRKLRQSIDVDVTQ
jgi:chromosome segregation ATPase